MFNAGCGLWNGFPALLAIFDVKRDGFFGATRDLAYVAPGYSDSREIGNVGAIVVFVFSMTIAYFVISIQPACESSSGPRWDIVTVMSRENDTTGTVLSLPNLVAAILACQCPIFIAEASANVTGYYIRGRKRQVLTSRVAHGARRSTPCARRLAGQVQQRV